MRKLKKGRKVEDEEEKTRTKKKEEKIKKNISDSMIFPFE